AKATLVQLHPTLDAALLRLDRMLPLAAPVKLWAGSSAELVRKRIECEGIDRSASGTGASASAAFAATASGSSLGTIASLCSGDTRSNQVDGFSVGPPDDDAGAAFDAMDGGDPCFVEDKGDRLLVGSVAGASHSDPAAGQIVGIA